MKIKKVKIENGKIGNKNNGKSRNIMVTASVVSYQISYLFYKWKVID